MDQQPTGKSRKNAPWLKNVVALNQDNKEVADYLMDAADFWIKEADIDGLKIVAADKASDTFLHAFAKHVKKTNPN
ncbi:hypothetical protein P5G51_013095 [Virgibacillus sp. 179-BFC.A HS]|uniref:Uncharacterized protein n=1 Tax=Tigheibacillus jepli TaxID=3035914 RepID=A0ABU5CIM1_9BACI|nr:hypothetical protein [Virgibacillus sp. 179-BFC.A HS]MDY0406198.1 hypothetical protein [Virgibacillus sp. 179-BFC.A HS]